MKATFHLLVVMRDLGRQGEQLVIYRSIAKCYAAVSPVQVIKVGHD